MKQRLDLALVERGLAVTRAKAQALIMAGEVLVDGQRVDKAGAQVSAEADIVVKSGLPYVSRGGLKLAHALDVFGLRERIPGKVALDIGASTGGFTDVLLQAGAAHVYAVDVGTNQLAWKLRNDPRVTVLEQTNIRDLVSLPEPAQLATADVSFIGLELVTLPAIRLTTPDAFFIFLIKPQFEAGREQVGKGGVVRDLGVHRDVIIRLVDVWRSMGLYFAGLARSPITGPAGNVEYLAYLEKMPASSTGQTLGSAPMAEQSEIPNPKSAIEEAIDREVFAHGK